MPAVLFVCMFAFLAYRSLKKTNYLMSTTWGILALVMLCFIFPRTADRGATPGYVGGVYHDSNATTQSTAASASVCNAVSEQRERDALAQAISNGDKEKVMSAGSDMMNAESDCASQAKASNNVAHHTTLTALAYLYMAVYGPNMLDSRKTNLRGALSAANDALSEDGISDEDRKASEHVKQSAEEKLGISDSQ